VAAPGSEIRTPGCCSSVATSADRQRPDSESPSVCRWRSAPPRHASTSGRGSHGGQAGSLRGREGERALIRVEVVVGVGMMRDGE
jgi:hypothetical protein